MLDTKLHVDKIFLKLSKKDPKQFKIIYKKIEQILIDPYHFKPLRGDMFGARRVQVGNSFVLVYDIDEKKKLLKF